MIVVNSTKDKIIAQQVSEAVTFWQRLVGLLGTKELKDGQGLVIKPTSMVHTFFMSFAIDVIFLDEQGYVVKIIENMTPGQISPFVSSAQQVIELNIGSITAGKVAVGDQILIKNNSSQQNE
ncbi:MAG: DUF192 domain-containing protein [Bacillota bacterium]